MAKVIDIKNPDVSLNFDKENKRWILCVSKNCNTEKFPFSHSAKITRYYTNESMEWDELKAEINKINEEINKQRQNKSKQNACYHYDIRIFKDKRAVKLCISDCSSPYNRRNNAECFHIEPFDNC